MHRLGITHRDISPDNIILPQSDPGKAKLIDFGIARSAFGEGTIIAQRFAGKLNFASPEHVGLHGGEVTLKSDVYAFGLTLAAALLDMGGTQVNMVRRRQSVPDLSGIDPKIRGSIAGMLQPDPDDRPDTIAHAAAERPERTTRLSGPVAAPRSRRRWWYAGSAAAAICLIGGVVGWRVAVDRDEPATPPDPGARATLDGGRPASAEKSVPVPPPNRADAEGQKPAEEREAAQPFSESGARQPGAADPESRTRQGGPSEGARTGSEAPAQGIPPAPARPEQAPADPATEDGTVRDCGGCPPMIRVPGGSFSMGSTIDPTEKPVHTVRIKSFLLGRSSVSVGEWNACVGAGACESTLDGDPDQPANNLSWDDAQQYIRWLAKRTGRSYRLPSEAEWEYAARGGARTRFWWGDRFRGDMAACKAPAATAHAPPRAADFPANGFGLQGTTCLVAQWVSDCWHPSFRGGAPGNGSAWIGQTCQQRVLRGGSWKSTAESARPASRAFYDASVRYPTNGFRVAREP